MLLKGLSCRGSGMMVVVKKLEERAVVRGGLSSVTIAGPWLAWS